MNKITPRQKELLKLIYRFIKSEGFPPSFEEIKAKLGISSNQTVLDHLKGLERKGFIERGAKAARGIKIKPQGFKVLGLPLLAPFLGTSYAGTFTESFIIKGEWQELSPEVKQLKQEIFIIQVSGDSMIDAGIFDGDQLIAQPSQEFYSGDIVLAQTENGTTIKRFISQEDKPPYLYLKPENPRYQIIPFDANIKMQAKIIGKYQKEKIIPINPETKSFM